jgi:hypothetical protein
MRADLAMPSHKGKTRLVHRSKRRLQPEFGKIDAKQRARAPVHERRECVSALVVRFLRSESLESLLVSRIDLTFEQVNLCVACHVRDSNVRFDPLGAIRCTSPAACRQHCSLLFSRRVGPSLMRMPRHGRNPAARALPSPAKPASTPAAAWPPRGARHIGWAPGLSARFGLRRGGTDSIAAMKRPWHSFRRSCGRGAPSRFVSTMRTAMAAANMAGGHVVPAGLASPRSACRTRSSSRQMPQPNARSAHWAFRSSRMSRPSLFWIPLPAARTISTLPSSRPDTQAHSRRSLAGTRASGLRIYRPTPPRLAPMLAPGRSGWGCPCRGGASLRAQEYSP